MDKGFIFLDGQVIIVNGKRYRAQINVFFVPELQYVDVDGLRCQQNRATCHTTNERINLLKENFSRPVAWSSRTCVLTHLSEVLL